MKRCGSFGGASRSAPVILFCPTTRSLTCPASSSCSNSLYGIVLVTFETVTRSCSRMPKTVITKNHRMMKKSRFGFIHNSGGQRSAGIVQVFKLAAVDWNQRDVADRRGTDVPLLSWPGLSHSCPARFLPNGCSPVHGIDILGSDR